MSIQLLRGEVPSYRHTRLLKVPKWVVPSGAQLYWHIPREAYKKPSGLIVVSLWCGPSRFLESMDQMTNREPHELRCATCVGRYDGWQDGQSLVFRPRSAFDLPTYCPAATDGDFFCKLCGGKARGRNTYGGWTELRHTPGPLLAQVKPCPSHGWKRLRPTHNAEHGARCECGYVVRSKANAGGET